MYRCLCYRLGNLSTLTSRSRELNVGDVVHSVGKLLEVTLVTRVAWAPEHWIYQFKTLRTVSEAFARQHVKCGRCMRPPLERKEHVHFTQTSRTRWNVRMASVTAKGVLKFSVPFWSLRYYANGKLGWRKGAYASPHESGPPTWIEHPNEMEMVLRAARAADMLKGDDWRWSYNRAFVHACRNCPPSVKERYPNAQPPEIYGGPG